MLSVAGTSEMCLREATLRFQDMVISANKCEGAVPERSGAIVRWNETNADCSVANDLAWLTIERHGENTNLTVYMEGLSHG